MKINKIAKAVHTMNQLYCQQLGDFTQPDWADAEEWQKQSSRDAVKFHLDNPNVQTHLAHDKWVEEKQKAGWSYGPIKDVPNRKHPCMVSFFQLPPLQQNKDFLIQALVSTLKQQP